LNKKTLAIVLAISAFLRALLIWRSQLWYDENFSLLLSRLPLGRMLAATAGDVHPPLHYLTIWPIGQLFPDGPAWLIRIPSLIFSTLAVWVFWKILENTISKPWVRWTALGLMVLSPIQIYYAQEGRMYALLELTVLASCLAMLRHRWAWLAVCATLMLYTQNYGVFYIACLWVSGLLLHLDWRRLTASLAVAGALWMPWLGVMFHQMDGIYGVHWIPAVTPGGVIYALYSIFFAPSVTVRLEVLSVLVYSGLIVFSILYALRQCFTDLLPLLVMAFGPVLLSVITSLLWQPVTLFRPLIGCAPFLIILLALPAQWIFERRTRILYAAILVIPIVAANLISLYYFGDQRKNDDANIDVLQTIEADWQPGDIIYHISDASWINMTPYAGISAGQHYKFSDCGTVLGALTTSTRNAMGYQVAQLEDIPYIRAWIITAETPMNPPCDMDYVRQFTGNTSPVSCFTDTQYIRGCIYLVDQP
jgi:uncharacterized membrane protein